MGSLVLGRDISSGHKVKIRDASRRQGVYIIGKTGSGKSTLISDLVVQDMESGAGLCLLDPHGDLVDEVLARVPAEREQDVVLLDAADTAYPFGLNLFHCPDVSDDSLVARIATQAVEVFEKLWGDLSWGPRVAQILRNCSYTLIENQGYTLAEIPRLLLDDAFRESLIRDLRNQQVREFWQMQYNPRSPRERLERVESTLNKVDEFLTPAVRPIVGMGQTTVDLRRVMDDGKVLLVRLALGEMGARTVRLLGSVLVGQILNAALSRQDQSPEERRQFNLYADEYHRFATPSFAELLAESRKFALATTLAHQFRDQLEDDANRGATLNAANLIVFAVHGEDGEELAKQFDRTPPKPKVIGQRAKLKVAGDTTAQLLRRGHKNPRVQSFVTDYLLPMDQARRVAGNAHGHVGQENLGPADTPHWEEFADRGRYEAQAGHIDNFFALADQVLVRGRKGVLIPESLASLALCIRGYLGIAPQIPSTSATREQSYDAIKAGGRQRRIWGEWETQGPLPSLTIDARTADAVNQWFDSRLARERKFDWDASDFLTARSNYWKQHLEIAIEIIESEIEAVRAEERAGWPTVRLYWKVRQPPHVITVDWAWEKVKAEVVAPQLAQIARWETEVANLTKVGASAAAARAAFEYERLERFGLSLVRFMSELTSKPLFSDSGRYEPIYDRPRSYADVEAEVSSALVALPNFQARCRVEGRSGPKEFSIRTERRDSDLASPDVQARVTRIRAHTRANFCLPRSIVEAAIASRSQLDGGMPEPAGTARRVPLSQVRHG